MTLFYAGMKIFSFLEGINKDFMDRWKKKKITWPKSCCGFDKSCGGSLFSMEQSYSSSLPMLSMFHLEKATSF